MADINWLAVEAPETTAYKNLVPGGYVATITDVEYNDRYEFWSFVYDIAEGEFEGYYGDDWGQSHPYAHSFTKNKFDFDGNPDGRFKRFLMDLQHSNRGKFDIAAWQAAACDVEMFVGCQIGIVLQKMLKTNNKGVDTEYLEVYYTTEAADIRNGDYKLPEVRDKRQKASAIKPTAPSITAPAAVKPSAVDTADIPF